MAEETFHEWLKDEVVKRIDLAPRDIVAELEPVVEKKWPGNDIKLGSVRGWLSTARREKERQENTKTLRAQVEELSSMVAGISASPGQIVNDPNGTDPQAVPMDPGDPTPPILSMTETTMGADMALYRSKLMETYVRPTDGSWEMLQWCLTRRKPCILVGGQGTGKSTMAEAANLFAGLDPVEITCDENTEREDLLGRTNLVNDEGVQVTEDQMGPMVTAATHGRPLVINEVGMIPGGVQSSLFRLLEMRPFRNALTGDMIVPHQGFTFIGTANHLNLGDAREIEFTTGRTSAAFRSRVIIIPVPYLTEEKEIEMVKKQTKARDKIVKEVVQFANLTREQSKSGHIRIPVCSRIAISMAEYLNDGHSVKEALRFIVLGAIPEANHAKIDEAARAIWKL